MSTASRRRVLVEMTDETCAQLRAIARVSRALAFEGEAEALPTAAEHVAAMGQIADLAAALADGPTTLTLDWRSSS